MSAVTTRYATESDLDSVRGMCRKFRADLAERARSFPELMAHYCDPHVFEEEVAWLPRPHVAPDGAIVLAIAGGQPIGVVLCNRICEMDCQLRLIFVESDARRRGAARALIDAATEFARALRCRYLKFHAICVLPESVALFRELGFSPCEPFDVPKPELSDYLIFFGKDLQPQPAR